MASFVKNHHSPYETLIQYVAAQPLQGKSVLITGAGRGVGLHISRAIAAAGAARIGLVGRNKSRIEEARVALSKDHQKTEFDAYAADVSDQDAVAAVFQDFGVPDVLINNAGAFPDDGPFLNQDLKSWWSGFETNILGTAVVTQKYLQAKGPNAPGIVLNCSTLAIHFRAPLHGWAGYNSSKLGQARIFETLRFEHPEVRFLSIHPGQIDTDGFERSGAPRPDEMTDGQLAGQFFAWAATDAAEFLSGRFVWAEWDIDELKARKQEILEKDLLLTTIDGFDKGL
jgi:NAD(P)-dependent dehydrogenase (short-subunit alcohol dehydrogenase family)